LSLLNSRLPDFVAASCASYGSDSGTIAQQAALRRKVREIA
jgi:hypothetical protein